MNKIRKEKGTEELNLLQAYIAARSAGIQVPESAMWLLNQTFDPRVIKGTVLCTDGHENTAGAKFCAVCGMKMNGHKEIVPSVEEELHSAPEIPLATLHVATLKKMARERGLPDKGKKEDLITRLGGLCREHLACAGTAEAPEGAGRHANVPHGPGALIAKQTSAKIIQLWKMIIGCVFGARKI